MARIRGIAALAISLLLLFCAFAVPAVAENDVTTRLTEIKNRVEAIRQDIEKNIKDPVNSPLSETKKREFVDELMGNTILGELRTIASGDLTDDQRKECLRQLSAVAQRFYVLRNLFNADADDYTGHPELCDENRAAAETGRQACRDLMLAMTGNPLVGESKIDEMTVKEEETAFSWQWNDQNIQQVGATRPPKDLRGEYTWLDTNQAPTTTDRYLGVYANVYTSVDSEGNPTDMVSLPLLDFYHDYCGFSWPYIYENFQLMAGASRWESTPDEHGGETTIIWEAGKLIDSFIKRDDTTRYHVTYSLGFAPGNPYEDCDAFGKIPGYQITYKDDTKKNVLITPTVSFTGNVIWYDNHDTYTDPENQTYRPTFDPDHPENLFVNPEAEDTDKEKKEKLYTLRRVYKDDRGELQWDTVQVTNDMCVITAEEGTNGGEADTWTISFPELPKYSEDGKLYTYHLVQNEERLENLNGSTGGRGGNKGTYYSAQVNNPALVESGHENCIHDQGTVTNTLSYNGSILINKEWIDGNRSPDDRPETKMYFYRVAEPDALDRGEIDGSPVPGYDKCVDIQEIVGNPSNPGEGSGETTTQGQALGEFVQISVPEDEKEWLPIFDNYGRRYIYYAVEMMDGQGDYQVRINNQGVSVSDKNEEEKARLIAMADEQQLILNGATVTNVLEADQRVPVTVDFKAQAIQNTMDGAKVELQLQYYDAEADTWVNYSAKREDGTVYHGELTIDSFQAEAMTVTGYSDPVPKYDTEGNLVKYRWVQTNLNVNNGEPVEPLPDDKPTDTEATLKDKGNEVGPGVDNDKTTERFDIKYSEDKDGNTVITNTLVGDTQIEVTKTWTYTLDDGTTYTYSSDGGNWDGTWKSLEEKGVKVPADVIAPAQATLTYNVYRNGVPYKENGEPVTITMTDGATTGKLAGLPRYDENGNEYTYTTAEERVEGWGSTWDYIVSVEDDAKGKTGPDGEVFRVTQLNAGFSNFIGPGNVLYFDITKEWEDDTDIQTRRPVQVAVFTLGGELVEGTNRTLDLVNNWHTRVAFEAPKNDKVQNYVVKEISVGSDKNGSTPMIPVQYVIEDYKTLRKTAIGFHDYIANDLSGRDPFAKHKYAQPELNGYRVGSLADNDTDTAGMLEYFYYVYMSASETGTNYASYTIYNQRYGDVVMELAKEWINGAEHAAARFVVEQKQKDANGKEVWVRIPVGKDEDGKDVLYFELNSEDATGGANGKKTLVWNSTGNADLPKYDAQGVLYDYRVVETEMAIYDENNELYWIPVVNGVADFGTAPDEDGSTGETGDNGGSTGETGISGNSEAEGGIGSNTQLNADRYVCSVSFDKVDYKQAAWKDKEDDDKGASPHNSGDVYYWNGVNQRVDSYPISIYKVWRDGAGQYNRLDSVSRPDITFQLYRVSYAELRAAYDNLKDAKPEDLIEFVREQEDVKAFIQQGPVHHVSEHKLWNTSDDPTTDAEVREHNYWLWYCNLASKVDKYDAETGSRYIYFCVEEMYGNSHNYQATYDNLTEEKREELAESGYKKDDNGYNTETTYQEGEGQLDSNLLIIYDGLHDEDYYSRIVVNTRQNEADIDVKKVWNISDYQMYVKGDGIPLSEMPPVTLHLWRDVGEMTNEGDTAEDRFQQAEFSQAQHIDTIVLQGSDTISFPSEDYKNDPKHADELVEVNGELKLPRYNEYGYRYSYWITEEPIHSYTSGSMVEVDEDGKPQHPDDFNPEADIFQVTNSFVVQPPYVELDLTKTWNWNGINLEKIPDDKKNFTVTFELHAVMVNASGTPINSPALADVVIATQDITVKGGEPQKNTTDLNTVTVTGSKETGWTATLSFKYATDGGFANKKPQLPYWAPNGRPFRYYVVERTGIEYDVSTVKVNGAVVADAGIYGNTGLIEPEEPKNDLSQVQVEYTNTYNGGGFRSLRLQKNWTDNTNLDPKPEPPQSVKVKLYRMWDVGNDQYGVEQVTASDERVPANGSDGTNDRPKWTADDADGTFTIRMTENAENGEKKWELELNGGLYRLAPNGKPYEYFIVEEAEYADEPDTDNITGYNGYYAALSTSVFPDRNTLENSPTGGASYITVSKKNLARQRGYSNAVQLPENADGTVIAAVTATNDWLYKTVQYTKSWKKKDVDSNTPVSLTDNDVAMLAALGVLPEQMSFAVQYSMDGGTTWQLLKNSYDNDGHLQKASSWEEAVHRDYTLGQYKAYITSGTLSDVAWKLPAYAKNEEDVLTEVEYRVAERMVFADHKEIVYCGEADAGNQSSSEHPDFTIGRDEDQTDGTLPNKQTITNEFTNTIETRDILLRKIWEGDNANRDDTRPDRIKIKVELKNPSDPDDAGGMDDPNDADDADDTDDTDDPNDTENPANTPIAHSFEVELTREGNLLADSEGNIYQSATYSVLASLAREEMVGGKLSSLSGFEVTEVAPVDDDTYEWWTIPLALEAITDADGNVVRYEFSATNRLNDTRRKTIDLTAAKTWAGEVTWDENTRPAQIRFTLEYRFAPKGTDNWSGWATATPEATGVGADGPTNNAVKVVSAGTSGTNIPPTSATWYGLYQYRDEDKTAIPLVMQYRVKEEMLNAKNEVITTSYSMSGAGYSNGVSAISSNITGDTKQVTLTNTLNKTSVSVKKLWKDSTSGDAYSDNKVRELIDEGILPSHVQFTLYYRVKKTTGTANAWWESNAIRPVIVSVKEKLLGNAPYPVFTGLPRYNSQGEELEYKLEETGVCYNDRTNNVITNSNSFTVGYNGTTVTNTLKVGSLTVTKNWDDMDDRDGVRPAEIVVKLYRDNVEYDTKTLNASNRWTCTWNDLPVYQQNGTTLSQYRVAEGAIKTVTTDDGKQVEQFIEGITDKYTLTNPNSLEVELTNAAGTITLTNEHLTETIDVSATKQWVDSNNQDGLRPASVTFRLEYSLGGETWSKVTCNPDGFTGKSEVSFSSVTGGDLTEDDTVTLTGGSTVTWSGLPKYAWTTGENAAKRTVQYRVVEESDSKAYELSKPVQVQNGVTSVTVINSLKTTNLTAHKVWTGDDEHTNYRKSVTFKLMYHTGDGEWEDFRRGGKTYKEELKEENNWTAVFEKLPTYTANGAEYHYKVVEIETSAPKGYTNGSGESEAVEKNGSLQATITNTFVTVDIPAEKIWNDGENRDGKRPGSIVLKLMVGEQEIASQTVSPDENGDWKYTFTSLPKYNPNGSEIAYTVEEEDVRDYGMTAGSQANGYKVINDYQPKTINVSATKQWEDNHNQDGVRPASVTFQLQYYSLVDKDWYDVEYDPNGLTSSDKVFFTDVTGVDAGSWTTSGTATLTSENTIESTVDTWGTVTWNGLPKYARNATKSVEVQYRVVEVSGSKRYITTSVPATIQGDTTSVTVTNRLKTTNVSVQKVWKNSTSGNAYSNDEVRELIHEGILPSHVRFALYERVAATTGPENAWVPSRLREPVFVRVEDLIGSNGYSFEGLPQYNEDSEMIEYRLMEIGVYFAENADEEAETATPKYHAAVLNTDDPTASGSIDSFFTIGREGTTIINTLTTVDIPVNKVWNDGENPNRPDITFMLMKGSEVIAKQTVSAQEQWAYTFKGLPKYDKNGQPITYTVEELSVEGYLTTITGSMETGYTVTNTQSTQIPGEKTWNDGDNRDGLRPKSITINLKGVGTNGYTFNDSQTVSADADGNWKYTFANLPKYDPDGEEIHYSVTEEGVENYSLNIEGFNVTNTHTPEKTTFAVSKKWDDQENLNGLRPESVTFRLQYRLDKDEEWTNVSCNPDGFTGSSEVSYSHVLATSGQVITEGTSADVTLKGSGDTWGTLTWYDLPAYVRRGETTYPVQYQAEELEVPQNYTSFPSEDGHTVTNTLQMTSVKVTKSWKDDDAYQDDYRPDNVTVALLYQIEDEGDVWHEFIRNGEPYTAELKADEDETKDWTAEFTNLPKSTADGKDYCYKVEEMPVTAYSTEITGSAEAGYTVTNTLETVELAGRKVWLDGENQDGKRPAEITIRLRANGEEVDEARMTEADGWSWKFSGKPKYDPNGDVITYTVSEDPVEGYAATIAGNTVINVQLTSIPVTKNWEDGEDKEGVRPQKITVTLKRDGQEILSVELNAENGWTHTFDNLPKYDADNKAIAYTVEETPVTGYSTEITGNAEAGYTITNTLMDRTISVMKVWDDEDNRTRQRPAEITVTLKRDGVADQTATLNSQNDWYHEFTGLLKYDRDGREIAYTVEESRVEDYTGQITGDMENGFTMTNKLVTPVQPEDPTIPYTFQKIWKDGGRAERPTSITFRIERPADPNYVDINNKVGVKQAGVRVDGDTWTWAQYLNPKYTYTVTEVNVPAGYISECVVNDETHTVTITNTYVPSTGDNSHLSWYVAALCVSLAGLVALYAGRKKKTR